MSGSRIRELSPEERALVSGGAQNQTTDLPPVEVTPPEDSWDPGVPDWPDDPYDPGWGDDGGGGGGGGDSGGSTTFTTSATLDGNGVASATQTWTLPDYNLTFNLTESLNLTNGAWGLAGSGSFEYGNQTYTVSTTTDHFSISGYSASLTQDYGNGVSFNIGLTYDPNSNSYSGQLSLVISGF